MDKSAISSDFACQRAKFIYPGDLSLFPSGNFSPLSQLHIPQINRFAVRLCLPHPLKRKNQPASLYESHADRKFCRLKFQGYGEKHCSCTLKAERILQRTSRPCALREKAGKAGICNERSDLHIAFSVFEAVATLNPTRASRSVFLCKNPIFRR